jgi:hypothetical protein
LTLEPSDVLERTPWLRCEQPFPHLVARGVFKPDFYRALERQILDILRLGRSEMPGAGRFARNLPGYDAYAIGLGHQAGQPSELFLSPAWRDLLAGLWNVAPTPYVLVGAHHHAPGSKHGFIHNDFNPVWFPRAPDGAIQTAAQELCSYKTGAGSLAAEDKVEVVRGAVLIFYLANEPWRPGDGGETGLYDSPLAPLGDPVTGWPPENNTLLSFECTPSSFHGYIHNRRIARTSIIMWVHRPLGEAIALYGETQLERWKV